VGVPEFLRAEFLSLNFSEFLNINANQVLGFLCQPNY